MNDIKEMDAGKVREIKKIFRELFNELNHLSNENNVTDALNEVLGEQHRTLQQNFFRYVVLPSIQTFANKQDRHLTDLRNEASCELAKQLEPLVKNACLPYI